MLLDALLTRTLASGLSPGVGPGCQVPHVHLGRAVELQVLCDTVTLGERVHLVMV